MRILFMAPMLDYSGAPKIMTWLANRFEQDGNEVHLLTYNSKVTNKKLSKTIKQLCLDVPFEKSFLRRNFISLPKTIAKVCDYIGKGNFDIIVTFTDTVSILCLSLAKLFKIGKAKFFISERSDPYTNTGKSDWIRRKMFGFADGIVFQTEEAKKYFRGKLRNALTVIPNPVIIDFYEKDAVERDNRIVSLGRLSLKQKRQDLIIKAFAKIADLFPYITVVLYGDGDDKYTIQEIIRTNHFEGRVLLAGVTHDVYSSIHNARLFVMASDFEGVPNALIEAMSIGVPVISTDCSPGGAKSLIQNGENGLLVQRGDIEALAKAIKYMLSHPQEAEKMAESAKNIRMKYAEDAVFQKWKEFVK